MTGDIAIRVSNLSKMFKIYTRPADMFWELLRGEVKFRTFWALRDVGFEVKRGQMVGIIGRNGAGKSTLLKLITGTLDKTTGDIDVNGRVSSILELGTGFNDEFSGRDNVHLGGLMMGLTGDEIRSRMDWIISFSELENFIDQPFKTYSSGMKARLTFSTAVCVDPDLLIVDEALSVGDIAFQRKSFGKFEEFRRSGKTILFVSHNTNTINQICDHAILLSEGRILEQGPPKLVTRLYERMLFGGAVGQYENDDAPESPPLEPEEVPSKTGTEQRESRMAVERSALLAKLNANDSSASEIRYGSGKVAILECDIVDRAGISTHRLASGAEYTFLLRALFREQLEDIHFGFGIRTVKGFEVFATNTYHTQVQIAPQKPGNIIEVQVDVHMWLAPGDYFLTVGAWGLFADTHYDRRVDTLHFQVSDSAPHFPQCVVNLQSSIHTVQVSG